MIPRRLRKGFYTACDDLKIKRRFVVNSGAERFHLDTQTQVMGVSQMAQTLADLD